MVRLSLPTKYPKKILRVNVKGADVPDNPFVKRDRYQEPLGYVSWRGEMVLEIKKTIVSIDENELIELERIIIDQDKEEALRFLRKSIFEKIRHSQQGKLKSHLDGESNPAEKFNSKAEDI